jgi:uncharacterized protein (TIGR00290 family)
MRPKAIVSWSSGKDSALALHEARRTHDVVALVTTVTDDYARVSMHGVREALLDAQAAAAGLPLIKVRIRAGGDAEAYERAMDEALARARGDGIYDVIFGDLFLADLRAWREARLAAVGMRACFPLWQRPTAPLAREMVALGVDARLVCLDPQKLDPAFAGRRFDAALLDALPPSVDPCGENGEFHTCVVAGPMFSRAIPVRAGAIVTREGFVFADLLPD